jgi:putative nucleotidyltransferase with HDIG domain
MSTKQNLQRGVELIGLLAACWFAVYANNGTSGVCVHLFYFPIILAARFWGWRGGAAVGLLGAISLGPWMQQNIDLNLDQTTFNWMIRIFFFSAFGALTGILFSILKNSRNQILLQNAELEQKNEEIINQKNDILQQKNDIEQQRNEIEKTKDQIKQFGTEIIKALAQAIEIRDPYTSGHCQRVAELAYIIGDRMGLSERELLSLKWSALVHDVGKIGVPEHILNKEGRLTELEYEAMKKHTELGMRVLSGIQYADNVMDGVRHHHERMDGSGYPDGLTGAQIALQARIIGVCDVWDALTSNRSYRKAMTDEEAMTIMLAGRSIHFDAEALDILLDFVKEQDVC